MEHPVYVIAVCRQLLSRIRMEHPVYVIQVCRQLLSRIRMEHPVYVIQVCRQLFSRIRMEQDQDGTSWSCSKAVYKPVWHIPLLCVQWKTPDDGQMNCPKHVVSLQNKFEKLVHLVDSIIRILFKTKHFTFINRTDVLRNISCKEHLPEDCHNRWLKHVGGYAAYTIIRGYFKKFPHFIF